MLSREERMNLNIDGRIYICYDYIFAISTDRILATHGGSISLITADGDMICTYDSIYVPTYANGYHYNPDEGIDEADYEYIDDILIFVDKGKKGLIDYDGNIICEAKYHDIEFNSDSEVEVTL